MPAAVVAFAFGTPNTLRSNWSIAQIASETAASLHAPVYTQRDVVPLASHVEIELTQENYPERVPTLRIARGAIAWAQEREIDVLWLCAAGPHIARCRRDLQYAIKERRTAIEVKSRQASALVRWTFGSVQTRRRRIRAPAWSGSYGTPYL